MNLSRDDIAASGDTAPTSSPGASIDRLFLLGLAAQLDAHRSMIDAALVTIDAILGDTEGHPVELASSDVTDDEVVCPHPASRRQSLNTIGSGDDTPRWRCRDCQYEHNPLRRD